MIETAIWKAPLQMECLLFAIVSIKNGVTPEEVGQWPVSDQIKPNLQQRSGGGAGPAGTHTPRGGFPGGPKKIGLKTFRRKKGSRKKFWALG